MERAKDGVMIGDITSHISSGIDAMSEALSHDLSLLMWYLLRGVCYYAMMLWISVPLTFFITVALLFILLLPKLTGSYYQVTKEWDSSKVPSSPAQGNLAMQVQESLAKANEVAMETFQAISTVRSFANEDGAAQRYEKKLEETYQLNKKEAVAYGASLGVPEVLVRSYPSVQKAVGSSEKAFQYMDRTPQIKASGTLAPANLKGHMKLENVWFSYPTNGNSPVLKVGAGESGKLISGGQKQAIALARALIRNPTVLILDDATSALDAESQQQLEKEIYDGEARGSRSVLLISHRLRNVKRANLILVMEDGEIREKGTYRELEDKKGLFWQLLQKQPNGAEGGRNSIPNGNNRH
ncbi:hypothetical protein Chor_011702 [Crotalus horridus]